MQIILIFAIKLLNIRQQEKAVELKINGSQIDSAIKAFHAKTAICAAGIVKPQKNDRTKNTLESCLGTINIRNFHIRGRSQRKFRAMFRHQSLSSNKYAPSNFRKEFAFRFSRCRALTTLRIHGFRI